MSLTHAAFAVAGLIAAAGPVIVHLLNRRRYRTVEWGAMAFLRKAMHRTRRSVRLRDLLLLLLRTAAVLLFGLALARPFYSNQGMPGGRIAVIALAVVVLFGGLIGVALARSRGRRFGWSAASLAGVAVLIVVFANPSAAAQANAARRASSREPVHAIFVIDNSRSMGVRSITGTLLDAAKQRVETALSGLPSGSRVSILPLCGPERTYTLDAYTHTDDARAALERIEITDRAGSALTMLSLAAEAAGRVPDIAGKQIVFLGDQQATGWPAKGIAEAAKTLDVPVQLVTVGDADTGLEQPNLWIESFTVQDGLAEADLPTTFLARVRYAGVRPISDVDLTLEVEGRVVASQTVELRPAQSRDITLTATLDAPARPEATQFLNASLTLKTSNPDANRLERDDRRFLSVPFVTSVPVVFIDEVGDDENLDAGRVGETYRLRRLLAPRPAEGVYAPLVAVRHTTLDQLTQQMLEEARLVVVAGVERPTDESVHLLRQYVEQGGPLLIAAGGSFDPAAWTTIAWSDGRGVLPVPLDDVTVGLRPSQAVSTSKIEPFRLNTSTLDHPFFTIAGEPAESLADLWNAPFFFQAVHIEMSDTTLQTAVASEAARIDAERKAIAAGQAADADVAPAWLAWKNEARAANGDNPDMANVDTVSPKERAASTLPRALARFDKTDASGVPLPYLVERRLGYGRVVFMASGISSDWDTLSQTNAIVLLDRITRSLIQDNLPRRMFEAGEAMTLPVERRPDIDYVVSSPNSDDHPVSVDATGRGYAVRLDDTSVAGEYRVTANRPGEETQPLETIVHAVNGSVEESKLLRLTSKQLADRVGEADIQLVAHDESISLTGQSVGGSSLWKWVIAAVLICLCGEMCVAGYAPRRVLEAAT